MRGRYVLGFTVAAVAAALVVPAPASAIVGGTTPVVTPNSSLRAFVLVGVGVVNGQASSFCTGTLIAKRWVLTGAHCVDGAMDVRVLTGNGTNKTTYSVIQPKTNPNYSSTTGANDVALLQLGSDVAGVAPVPLLNGASAARVRPVVRFGFGSTEVPATVHSESLRQSREIALTYPEYSRVRVPACEPDFPDPERDLDPIPAPDWNVGNALWSKAFDGGANSGDSGGPVVVDAGGKYVLAGVTMGVADTAFCEPADPRRPSWVGASNRVDTGSLAGQWIRGNVTGLPAAVDIPASAGPQNLRITKTAPTSVALTWSGVTGAIGYRVYRDGIQVATTGATGVTVAVEPGSRSSFSVSAYSNTWDTPYSNAITATTGLLPPGAPALSVAGRTSSSVTLSWTNSGGATDYRIYEGNTLVESVGGATLTHTLRGLAASTTHTYTVTAVGSGGAESARSNAVTVNTLPSWLYAFSAQSAANADGSAADLAHARPGQTYMVTIVVRNTGTATWSSSGANPVLLGTARPQDHVGVLKAPGWVSPSRAARLQEPSVAPGGTGTFRFPVAAPQSAGTTTEYFNLVAEGMTWLNDAGLSVTVTTTPVVGVAAAAGTSWHWLVAADGGVFTQAGAPFFGSQGGRPLNAPIVGIAGTPTGRGYWLVGADGGVFAFGDAAFHGSTAGQGLVRPIVGMAPTPTGRGYWLVGGDGGVFAFGDAPFAGSMAGRPLNAGIVGIAGTPTGRGYRLVGSDGGVFAFGDASFAGSMAGRPLNAPISGIAADPIGNGYWLIGRDGGVYAFDAPFLGSGGAAGSALPVVGMTARAAGYGYTDTAGNYRSFGRGGAGNGPADGMLFKEASSVWVYVCYGGAKFRIPDAATFDAMGLSWAAIRTLPDGDAATVADIPRDGTVLREMTNPYVHRIENGRKRLVTLDEFVANSYGAILRYVPNGGLNQIPSA